MQATSLKQKARTGRNDWPAALLALLIKGKALLFSLVKLKFLLSLATAVISIFAYARGFGFAGATGFVILLFVHEMGHVLMLRSQGVPASVPMFIPFVGAIISMKAYPKGVVDEAYTAIAGPLLGSAGALVCLAVYFGTGLKIWAWLAYVGFFLNLFNLLPMSPLDGGRIVGAVWRGFWIIGVIAAVAIATWLSSPVLLLFSVFGLSEINRRWMRVHWSAYALLGALAVVSSAMCDEIVWGFIVAFFAFSHGRRAHAVNSALAFARKNVHEYRARIIGAEAHYLSAVDLPAHKGKAVISPLLKVKFKSKSFPGLSRHFGSPLDETSQGVGAKYFNVPARQRLIIGSMYTGLAVVLIAILAWIHNAGIFFEQVQ